MNGTRRGVARPSDNASNAVKKSSCSPTSSGATSVSRAEGDDIPSNLPPESKAEALTLRNTLLLFRFRRRDEPVVAQNLVDRTIRCFEHQRTVRKMSEAPSRSPRRARKRGWREASGSYDILRTKRLFQLRPLPGS